MWVTLPVSGTLPYAGLRGGVLAHDKVLTKFETTSERTSLSLWLCHVNLR